MTTQSKTTIEGETGEWEVVIGLEVHAQVSSQAKLFSGAATAFGAAPNSQVSFVDAAFPGMLPVINKTCVEQAVRTGLGLQAKINLHSVFDRKNYFYPDLPPGYQISQYQQPIVGHGTVELDLPDGGTRSVGITRLHLEQDAGKSLHDQDPKNTYVDLNRAGVALMEIVSEPDLRSSEEAGIYIRKLRSILRYLGTCDGNMEEGSMRADVNVSVRRPGNDYGTRTEIKNVNSVRFVEQAIDYEAARQVEVLEDGGSIDQETRLFDPNRGETRPMRSKEEAHDYRYFPDPDLLPLVLDKDWVEEIKANLPELPDQKKARFIERYELSEEHAKVLVADKETADAFEEIIDKYLKNNSPQNKYEIAHDYISATEVKKVDPDIKEQVTSTATTSFSVSSAIFGFANDLKERPAEMLRRLDVAGLVQCLRDEVISSRMAKDVIAAMVESGNAAAEIVEEKGLKQITDTGAIEAIVDKIIADNPDQAEQARANPKAIGWFVGQVMQQTQGQANPKSVNELLRKKLSG